MRGPSLNQIKYVIFKVPNFQIFMYFSSCNSLFFLFLGILPTSCFLSASALKSSIFLNSFLKNHTYHILYYHIIFTCYISIITMQFLVLIYCISCIILLLNNQFFLFCRSSLYFCEDTAAPLFYLLNRHNSRY